MVKMVLMDFYSRRKQTFKENRITLLQWLIYGTTCFNFVINSSSEQRLSDFGINTIQIMFIVVIAGIHGMYPNYLPPAMCLVPFSHKEKKEYLWTALWVKVGITSGLHLLWNMLLVAKGILVWWKAALLVICLLMFNVQQGTQLQSPAMSMEVTIRKTSVAEFFLCLLSLINYTSLVASTFKRIVFGNGVGFGILVGMSVVAQLLCAVLSFSKCQQRMEAGATVEKVWKKRK